MDEINRLLVQIRDALERIDGRLEDREARAQDSIPKFNDVANSNWPADAYGRMIARNGNLGSGA